MKLLIRKHGPLDWRAECPASHNDKGWCVSVPSQAGAMISADNHLLMYHTPEGTQALELEELVA